MDENLQTLWDEFQRQHEVKVIRPEVEPTPPELKLVHSVPLTGVDKLRYNMRAFNRRQAKVAEERII